MHSICFDLDFVFAYFSIAKILGNISKSYIVTKINTYKSFNNSLFVKKLQNVKFKIYQQVVTNNITTFTFPSVKSCS